MSDTAPAKRWFYVRDGRRHGPVEARDVVDHILAGDITEDALVWHSGLPEWQPARAVEGIREELPPPVPVPAAPAPPEPVSLDADEDDADEDGDDDDEPDDPDDADPEAARSADSAAEGGASVDGVPGEPTTAEAAARRRRRRRKRKAHHHRPARRQPPWLVPLLVVLVALMIGLWWLLRRMNEVPPGTIIQTGSLLEAGGDYRVALGREPSTTVSDTSWPPRFTTNTTSSPGFFSPSA